MEGFMEGQRGNAQETPRALSWLLEGQDRPRCRRRPRNAHTESQIQEPERTYFGAFET